MTRYAIGLGSNLGDRLGHLRHALDRVHSEMSVVSTSSLYETEPIGGPEQGPYLNAVIVVETDLDPVPLLDTLHRIEAEAGRHRAGRWAARTLDLDILAWDGPAVMTGGLEVPHPRASEREFVLRPLVETWPGADVGGMTAKEALARVPDQGVDRLRSHWADDSDRWVGWLLVSVQMAWFIAIALAFAADGRLPGDRVGFTHVVGGGLAFVGMVLSLWASRRLGAALTAVPEPATGADLVETGPYALARHPIYGGVVLFLSGTALFLDSVAGVVLTGGLGVFFGLKSVYEERRLRVRYPDYQGYRRRVTRRLIPFVF